MTSERPTRRELLALAWPLVLAQSATALPGLVDTACMGRWGDRHDLAAVAVAAVAFSFLYWAFGFLRMSTTGLTARAIGEGDLGEANAGLLRAIGIGLALGVALLALHPLTRAVVLGIFTYEPPVRPLLAGYLDARIVGAPAALVGFAINGWLLGRGRTRALLGYQLVLNGGNATLDAVFVGWAHLGPAGIGLGTALAEWLALGVGLWLVRDAFGSYTSLLDRTRLAALFSANRDILLRTVALLASFAWFVDSGSRLGSAEVAGNQVLLQLIAVSAFVLDAFAFLTEKEAGEAVGMRDPARLRHVARLTTELAFAFGALFSLGYLTLGPPVLIAVIADPATLAVALGYLPWCAAVPVLGIAAWQLDGVFLGATRGPTLRNAAIVSTLLYVALDLALRPWGNAGVWTAFVVSYVLRGVTLAVGLPALRRDLFPRPATHAS